MQEERDENQVEAEHMALWVRHFPCKCGDWKQLECNEVAHGCPVASPSLGSGRNMDERKQVGDYSIFIMEDPGKLHLLLTLV